jgi:membrane-associated phospholipid phosphatase
MNIKDKHIYSHYLKYLSPPDITGIVFLFILSLIEIIYSAIIVYWYLLSALNLILICLIVFIVRKYESKTDLENEQLNNSFSFIKLIRFWYAVLLILVCFKEVYLIIHLSHIPDIDILLIKIDHDIFGVNPTQWIYRFANPLLTEILEIVYFLYYLVIIAYGLELYLWRRFEEFKYATFIILVGFFLCYVVYMIFPAAGPRFYLHNFESINTELPGVLVTGWLREILNVGESIPADVPNPQDYVQRDAMPSAHAVIAVLLAYLSHKIKSHSFYFYLPYCILMIIATIYLRYHYVIDIIAGLLFAVITIGICNFVYSNRTKREYE